MSLSCSTISLKRWVHPHQLIIWHRPLVGRMLQVKLNLTLNTEAILFNMHARICLLSLQCVQTCQPNVSTLSHSLIYWLYKLHINRWYFVRWVSQSIYRSWKAFKSIEFSSLKKKKYFFLPAVDGNIVFVCFFGCGLLRCCTSMK